MNKNRESSLLSVKEMYLADQKAVSPKISSLHLMETAGEVVTNEIIKRWPVCKVTILCGTGYNGGDGFVVARLLKSQGWPVIVLLLGEKENLLGDAKSNADRWDDETFPLNPEYIGGPELIVDAIFGAGLTRDVDGIVRETLNSVKSLNVPIVAVDIPSGVQADSGQVLGFSLQCDLTVTFCRAKTGHYLFPGRNLCGELCVVDIGIEDTVIDDIAPAASLNGPDQWLPNFPWPRPDTHKFQRGHGIILGGVRMTGAARLAALCARRVGIGLITINAPSPADVVYQQAEPGNLISNEPLQTLLKDSRINTVLAGPGLGIGKKRSELIRFLLKIDKNLVLDADALTMISQIKEFKWPKRQAETVLTPHEGEFARLFPHINGSKIERACKAAVHSNCTILLKGPDTVIATPKGQIMINASETPWLATAGSGDCLAGICLGLMAQGLTGYDAACISAWLHGKCAEEIGQGLIAEDISKTIPVILKKINKFMQ